MFIRLFQDLRTAKPVSLNKIIPINIFQGQSFRRNRKVRNRFHLNF